MSSCGGGNGIENKSLDDFSILIQVNISFEIIKYVYIRISI